ASLVDLDAGVGDPGLDHALLGEQPPERGAPLHPIAQKVERTLGGADGAHAVVDATGSEAGLGHREPATLLAEEVGPRHPHAVEDQLAVSFTVLEAEHRQ